MPSIQKDQAVFLNQKGESQAQLSTVAGSLNSLKLNIEERRVSDRDGLQYYSEEQERHGDTPVSYINVNFQCMGCNLELLTSPTPELFPSWPN